MDDPELTVRTIDTLLHEIVPAMLDDLGLPDKARALRKLDSITSVAAAQAVAHDVAKILECDRYDHFDKRAIHARPGSNRLRRYAASHLGFGVDPLLGDPQSGDLVDRVATIYGFHEHAWSYLDKGRGLTKSYWDSASPRRAARAVVAHISNGIANDRATPQTNVRHSAPPERCL